MHNLNEENSNLKNKHYSNVNGNDYSYTNMTTKISRLKDKQKSGNISDEEIEELKALENKYEAEKSRDYAGKDAQRNAGRENAFIKTHEKDANPTKVGGNVKINSSGKHSKVSDQIMNNRVAYYESINSEIDAMRYLIEYMDNNKNKLI